MVKKPQPLEPAMSTITGNPMEILQQLMESPWVDREASIQTFMESVAARSSRPVRTSSPAEFVEDLVDAGILLKSGKTTYLLNL